MISQLRGEPVPRPGSRREPGARPSDPDAAATPAAMNGSADKTIRVALLTGGADKPYALGLSSALLTQGMHLDFIGSDEVDGPQLHGSSQVQFLNLRGNQRRDVPAWAKAWRIVVYYLKLATYALRAKPRVFHILWNNKWELFDRTVLMLYYRALGKQVVLTAHNVNSGKRDSNDTLLNRLSLRVQYRLARHVFVHSEKMKAELQAEFGVPAERISVIPFGINNTVPNTPLTAEQAKLALGLESRHKTVLFFGSIAPYKGLEYLVEAMAGLSRKDAAFRLVVAGPVKNCAAYWNRIQNMVQETISSEAIIERCEFVPDEEIENYFKAADVLVLPYTHIFQSGVLFLGYSFGLPVIATDVGSLKEDVLEGRSGFVCRPRDPGDLARSIETYFQSDLYKELNRRRPEIQAFANERYSWTKVGETTRQIYAQLLGGDCPPGAPGN